MLAIRLRRYGDRPLTIGEKFLAALTATLAVATIALAVATSARADPAGAGPGDGPYHSGPLTAISYSADAPAGPAPSQ